MFQPRKQRQRSKIHKMVREIHTESGSNLVSYTETVLFLTKRYSSKKTFHYNNLLTGIELFWTLYMHKAQTPIYIYVYINSSQRQILRNSLLIRAVTTCRYFSVIFIFVCHRDPMKGSVQMMISIKHITRNVFMIS